MASDLIFTTNGQLRDHHGLHPPQFVLLRLTQLNSLHSVNPSSRLNLLPFVSLLPPHLPPSLHFSSPPLTNLHPHRNRTRSISLQSNILAQPLRLIQTIQLIALSLWWANPISTSPQASTQTQCKPKPRSRPSRGSKGPVPKFFLLIAPPPEFSKRQRPPPSQLLFPLSNLTISIRLLPRRS